MPLAGLRSWPLAVNPLSITQGFQEGYTRAAQQEQQDLETTIRRLQLAAAQQTAAEQARPARTMTLGSAAVPPGLAAMPQAGEDPESRAFLPRTGGIPAAAETITEFPRQESPMQFEARRRRTQARLDAQQADAEAVERALAGDTTGLYRARARAYGHWMDAVDEPHRATMMKQRNEDLDELARLAKEQAELDPELASITAGWKAVDENPEDERLFWTALERTVQARDPRNQRWGEKWLQDAVKHYRDLRVTSELGRASLTIKTAILRKQGERRKANKALDEDEAREITLEVIQEHPTEFSRYMGAILGGKGPVPGMLMRFAFPGLETPKDQELYTRLSQEVASELTGQLGREPTPAEIEAKTDERYIVLRRGETPAAQRSKLEFQRAQTERALAGAARIEAKVNEEASVGGGFDLRRVTPGTAKGVTGAIEDINGFIATIRSDARKSEQEKDAEIMRWEQTKTRLHALLDRITQAQAARPTGVAPGGAVPPARPGGDVAPPVTTPSPQSIEITKRAKALYDADPDPKKGDWRDPTVFKKYQDRARGPIR